MNGHCVSVEVCIVRRTDERVHLDRVTFDQYRTECLDRLTVKCWCAIEKYVFAFDRFFEDRPDFGCLIFDETAGAADVVCEFTLQESCDHEWAEKFEHHVLWKTAFIECEIRSDDDDRAAGVVDALTEQVLAEIPVLTLEVISERLERTATASEDAEYACATAHGVIQECIDCFLQDAFFVAEDHFRRVNREQALEAVVAVDDAAIEVVEVRGCVTTAFECDHRAKCRWHNGETRHEHPLRSHIGSYERFRECEALAELVAISGTGFLVERADFF